MNRIGIVVALPYELRTLTKRRIEIGSWKQLSDRLLIAVSGVGSAAAATAVQLLLTNGADALLSWGCAGALRSHLHAGSLVLPKEIMSADGTVCHSDLEWHHRIYQILSSDVKMLDTGMLIESRQLAATTDQKQNLANSSQAVAVDMETATLANLAQRKQIPFIAIRAIADPLRMSLPKAVEKSLDANGKVNNLLLLGHLVSHPREIGMLIRLGLQFRAAQNTLRHVAAVLDHEFTLPVERKKNWVSG